MHAAAGGTAVCRSRFQDQGSLGRAKIDRIAIAVGQIPGLRGNLTAIGLKTQRNFGVIYLSGMRGRTGGLDFPRRKLACSISSSSRALTGADSRRKRYYAN
jgi:hypothetical protein